LGAWTGHLRTAFGVAPDRARGGGLGSLSTAEGVGPTENLFALESRFLSGLVADPLGDSLSIVHAGRTAGLVQLRIISVEIATPESTASWRFSSLVSPPGLHGFQIV